MLGRDRPAARPAARRRSPPIARVLPPAALTEALAIGLGTQAGDPAGPLLLLAAWAVVLAALAARLFRWD